MEKRWNVYHGSDYLGLKTAKEIREALRQGTLDPFDKVAREGSNIREDLIDVDEIFRENEAPEAAAASAASSDQPNFTVLAERGASEASVNRPQQANLKSRGNEAAEELTDADQSGDFSHRQDTGARQAAKRYYLVDREKVLGPLSALEIQSLFNRNLLNKKVRVQKIGNEKTIPITQFIANYSGDRLKELAEDGRIPQRIGVGSPSSRVMNELARMASSRRVAQTRRNHTYLMMGVVGLVVGAMVYFVYERSTSQPTSQPAPAVEEPASEPANKPRPRLIPRPQDSAPKKEPPKKPETTAEPRPDPRSESRPEPRSAEPKAVARPEPKRIESRPPPPVRKNPPATRVTQAPPEPRPTDNIPQQAATGPIAKAMEAAGRILTVGPLTFSLAALESCPSKCTLTLYDGTGASMKAVFFKNAYSDQLRVRSRGTYLTGNTKLDRGELTLFIQDVR